MSALAVPSMDQEPTKFADLMADAYRAVMVLDDVTSRDSAKAISRTLRDGRSVYAGLLAHQNTVRMTGAESALFQTAVDLIKARLKFLGEAV